MFPLPENDLGKDGKWTVIDRETILTALKRHRNGQVFLFNQALSSWAMVPGTWQSAGVRTKATRESLREVKLGHACHLKPVLTLCFLPHEVINFPIWSCWSQDFELIAAESFLMHRILVITGSNTKILVGKLDNPFNWYRMPWAAK